jgi:ATP-binding cassette subfamily F protein 3
MAAAQRAREQACELYLASKAAGGSRDVAIKSLILLSGAGKTLLDETSSLRLSQGHKYGLVGRNGTGKTTLLKAIASYELPSFPKHLKVVYVEQDPMHDLGSTPLATVLGYDLARTREPLLMASLHCLS